MINILSYRDIYILYFSILFLRLTLRLIGIKLNILSIELPCIINILKMISIIFIVVYLVLLSSCNSINCNQSYEKVCCKDWCPYCGRCNIDVDDNISQYVRSDDLYENFYNDCCEEFILHNDIICNASIHPPCVMRNKMNDLERFVDFFKTGPIWARVLVSIGLFIGLAFLLYVFFIFGRKDPPLDYTDVVNRLEKL